MGGQTTDNRCKWFGSNPDLDLVFLKEFFEEKKVEKRHQTTTQA